MQLKRLDIAIREVDIDSIKGNNLINDSIIKMYMAYLDKLCGNDELLFMDPSVVQMIRNVNTKEMEEHLNAMQIWYNKYIYIPVSDNPTNLEKEGGSHWSLLVYKLDDETWYHIDSCRGYNTKHARQLAGKINKYLHGSNPIKFKEPNCTQQDNGNDCGAYMMLNTKKCTELVENGEQIENLTMNRNKIKEMREHLVNIIMVERQIQEKGNGTKKQKKECEGKKGSKKINEMREPDLKDDSKSSLEMKDHGQSLGMNQGKKIEPEKHVRDNNQKECWFWNNRICKYGENCRDVHPTQCKIWLESGRCHDRGCKLSHPEICRLIYDSAYCNRKNCWFIHPTNIPNRYVHNERRHTPPNNSNFTQQHTQKTNGANSTARWTQENTQQNQNWQWNQQSNQNNQNNQNNQWNSSPFLGQWPTPWKSNSSTKMMLK